MADRPSNTTRKASEPAESKDQETRLQPSGEVIVEHHETPPSAPADKQIHPRRRLPLVPDTAPKPVKPDEKKGA